MASTTHLYVSPVQPEGGAEWGFRIEAKALPIPGSELPYMRTTIFIADAGSLPWVEWADLASGERTHLFVASSRACIAVDPEADSVCIYVEAPESYADPANVPNDDPQVENALQLDAGAFLHALSGAVYTATQDSYAFADDVADDGDHSGEQGASQVMEAAE